MDSSQSELTVHCSVYRSACVLYALNVVTDTADERTVSQQKLHYSHCMRAYTFTQFIYSHFKLHISQSEQNRCSQLSFLSGGSPHTKAVPFCGSCPASPENCNRIVQKLTLLQMGTSAAVVKGRRVFLIHLPHLRYSPDGLRSQTGNLAVTNPPPEPSGHSCHPC